MSNVNIFQNSTKTVPKSDEQIVRIDFTESQIAGRKSHLPTPAQSGDLSISHVPNASKTPG
jgi:hypothetical protein